MHLFFVALGQRELANTHYTTAALLSSPRLLATPPHKVTLPALAQKSTFVNIFHPSYLVYILRAKYKRRTKDEQRMNLRTPKLKKVLLLRLPLLATCLAFANGLANLHRSLRSFRNP